MIETALKSVRDLLAIGDDPFAKCESPSLRLEKFVRIGNALKGKEIEAVVTCQQKNGRRIPATLPANACVFKARLEANLIVNQAGGILENAGMCLHPHFGMPYIPGSAVKGVARHAAWCAWSAERDETAKFQIAQDIVAVFGYPTNDKGLDDYLAARGCDKTVSGSVCFLQAEPEGLARLAKDIVNCHHMDYYAGKRDVAYDNESANPQFFPSVKSGVKFIFALVPVRGRANKLELAQKWLVNALTTHGVGAKTAAGYGWFSYDPEEARREEEKRLREEVAARAARETAAREAELKAKEEAKRARRDAMTDDDYRDEVLARWGEKKPKQIMKTGDIVQFEKLSDNARRGVVLALRMDTGKGAEVWKELKSGQKGDIAKGADAIRKYCRDTMQLGKMP